MIKPCRCSIVDLILRQYRANNTCRTVSLKRIVNPSLIHLIILQDEEDISSTKRSRHVCEICGKVFTRPDKLKRHEKTHTNEKPHQCNKCDKSFHRNWDLKRHEKQVHERRAAQREYQCSTCGETFHNLAPFIAHQKTAHSKPSTTAKRPRQDDSGRKTLLQYQNNILYKLNDKYYVNFLCKAK